MEFKDKLNEYLKGLGCSARELASRSHLSPSTLSRYRSGERLPDKEKLSHLVQGITSIAMEKNVPGITQSEVEKSFSSCINNFDVFKELSHKFDTLLSLLNINATELSHFLHYDASYISRIRTGSRHPGNPEKFSAAVAYFVAHRYHDIYEKQLISNLIGCSLDSLDSPDHYTECLIKWFGSKNIKPTASPIYDFFQDMGDLSLHDYIQNLPFRDLRLPSIPFQFRSSREYIGFEQEKRAELDFLKTVLLSKSCSSLIIINDIPTTSSMLDFSYKVRYIAALASKKGIHIQMIQPLNRPLREIITELSLWLPSIMAGMVLPYFLKDYHGTVYGHLLYSFDTSVLAGECVIGFHKYNRYRLSKNKAEVEYYRQRAKNLLQRALPLFDIYKSHSQEDFSSFCLTHGQDSGTYHFIFSVPPLYTMPEEFLKDFLKSKNLADSDTRKILNLAAAQRGFTAKLLSNSQIANHLIVYSEDEFNRSVPSLFLADIFCEKRITYTYEEYKKHVAFTIEFEKKHTNYSIHKFDVAKFHNIRIIIAEDEWIMISKNREPAVHFVLRNQKLCSAIKKALI